VTYLLDVNALLALGFKVHVHYPCVSKWILANRANPDFKLATCAITELGFVRIACTSAAYATDISTAKFGLSELKAKEIVPFVFFGDSLGADQLPIWVQKSNQTTDGQLVELAKFWRQTRDLRCRDSRAELIP
jgi:hypothetical protein